MDSKLLRHLEELGIKVRPTASGYLAFCPGGTVSWHRNHSSHTTRNRAQVITRDFRSVGINLPPKVIAG